MDRWQVMNDSPEFAEGKQPELVPVSSRNRIILVGARRDAQKLLQHLSHDGRRRMTIVGFVDARHRSPSKPKLRARHLAVHSRTAPVRLLGGLERLDELVDRTRATDLVVAMSAKPRRHLLPHLAKFTNSDVTVHWVPIAASRRDRVAHTGHSTHAHHDATAEALHRSPSWFWSVRAAGPARLAKRVVDIVFAAGGLLVLSPLFALVSLAIFLSSGRPIFYTQERVGQGGRRFRIIKFRSMRADAERETGPIWASDHDSRCTRIGDWLRHTNIDELPQLFNVLKGEMSLVGPRPERPIFVEKFLPEHARVRPSPRRPKWHDRMGTGPRLARTDVACASASSMTSTTSSDGRSGSTSRSCS